MQLSSSGNWPQKKAKDVKPQQSHPIQIYTHFFLCNIRYNTYSSYLAVALNSASIILHTIPTTNSLKSTLLVIHSFLHSGYFYSASSSPLPLLLRGTPDYCTDTVSELTRRSATDNCE